MEDSSDKNATASPVAWIEPEPATEFDAFMDEIGAPQAESQPIEILVAWGVDDQACALEASDDIRHQLETWTDLADFLCPARPPGPGVWWYRGTQTFTAGGDYDLTGEWSHAAWPEDSKRGWKTIAEIRAGFEGLTDGRLKQVWLLGVEAVTLSAAHVAYSPKIVGLIDRELRGRGFKRVGS